MSTRPVTVVVVTWNSADLLPGFAASLSEAGGHPELVVVDNDSEDDTLTVAATACPGARILQTGRNAGYAAAINHATRVVPDEVDVVVANPDTRFAPGSLSVMEAAASTSTVGIVVPRLTDASGATQQSLRRDPSAWRTLAEALLGGDRAAAWGLGERVAAGAAYATTGPVAWASGAAMLVTAACRAAVGEWDESYFLYSEEVDYCQRARDAGYDVVYEPRAVVAHVGGELGTSPRLWALRAVNRVRHQRTRTGGHAIGFHLASILFEWRRALQGDSTGTAALRHLLHTDLDAQARLLSPAPAAPPLTAPLGVVVPAHQEADSIAATLESLLADARPGELELVVACNGCTDGTAEVARRAAPDAVVLDLETPSKTAAMNEADRVLGIPGRDLPVAYVDADVRISTHDLRRLARALAGDPIAVSPRPVYDVSGSTWPVRAYLRVWQRLPFTRDALSGTGAFVLSPEARRRVERFPDVLNDDAWVNAQFEPGERRRVTEATSIVAAPPDVDTLLRRKQRVVSGNEAVRASAPSADPPTSWRDLVAMVRAHPPLLLDLPAFLAITALVRRRAARHRGEIAWR